MPKYRCKKMHRLLFKKAKNTSTSSYLPWRLEKISSWKNYVLILASRSSLSIGARKNGWRSSKYLKRYWSCRLLKMIWNSWRKPALSFKVQTLSTRSWSPLSAHIVQGDKAARGCVKRVDNQQTAFPIQGVAVGLARLPQKRKSHNKQTALLNSDKVIRWYQL
jgi:hypothetical protein